MSIMNPIVYGWQAFIYGALKRRPSIDFSEIPSTINFVSHYDNKRKVHWVESPELPEFIVSGRTSEELAKNVGDTLLVYFDVPTYFAKRFPDGVFNFTNQKTGQQETIQVKKALDKVLA